MWALLTLVPTGLVVGLIAFGSYPGHARPEPTNVRLAIVCAIAVALGPVAVAVLGLFMWLLVVAVLAAGLTMVAMLRTPPHPQRGRVAHD
jgi:hypothetical protein